MRQYPECLTHNWFIEPREYKRQEERRGRRHAYEFLIPVHTALIVVDMVPFFIEENPYCRGILPNISCLAASVRAAGGTVAWVFPDSTPQHRAWMDEFYGEKVASLYADSGGRGTPQERLGNYLTIAPHDIIAEKTAASAFFPGRSNLPEQLQAKGIDTVIITGTVTNVCCESSARDAATLGYRVIMAADANAARRDEDHNATLYTIYRSFGDVRTTEDILAMLTSNKPHYTIPHFTTERLLLKGISEDDAESYEKHFVCYEVIGELTDMVPWPYPAGGVKEYIKNSVLPNQGIHLWCWGIYLKENPSEVIGAIHLRREGNPGHRGFWLGKDFWGKGYMTEAVRPINDYAFNQLGFNRMIITNAVGNIRSRRIKEKNGADFIGTEPARFVNPNYIEREVWVLTKEKWNAL